ncbi:MAG: hypothetical protein F6K42_04965 [Leptolyngbya sp. SIO1D8]|nr:hypothetical protein [Leptolyngbya sp. SIO1D8]
MRAYSRFNLTASCAIATSLFATGFFNMLVDPYGVLSSPVIANLNEEKPQKASNVRLFKAIDITHLNPKTVFLGSSQAEYGLNPSHPALDSHQPAYNLGIPNSNMYEMLRYLEHAIANQPDLEVVVIALDFIAFSGANTNRVDFDESRLEKDKLALNDLLNVTVSTDALHSSVETVIENIDQDNLNPYFPDGRRDESFFDSDRSKIDVFKQYINAYFDRPELYGQYTLSESMIENFEAIVALCQEKGITLEVFISPYHATQLEAIHVAGLWPVFEEWKRQIVEITPIWDFSGYSTVITEPVNDQMKYFRDSVHYREEIGGLILNRVLDYQDKDVPENFGIWVTPDNIETHLSQIRSDHQDWAAENTQLVQLVQEVSQ